MPDYHGITKLKDGNYQVRIQVKNKELKINTTRRKDDAGNPFKTKKAAADYRDAFIKTKQEAKKPKTAIKDATLAEVYQYYLDNISYDRAPATLRKQDSMWSNHIKAKFGDVKLSALSSADINGYLKQLYYYGDEYKENANYSYAYVDGFLKFFYLLISTAFSADYIDAAKYSKMCLDKATRIQMPKMQQEDDDDAIEIYDNVMLRDLDRVFARGNCYTAFLFGIYCGMRISEVFALTWSDYSSLNSTITVNKQLLYQDGVWCLCPVKTLQSVRVIDLPPFFNSYLKSKLSEYLEIINKQQDGSLLGYRNTERVINKLKKPYEVCIGLDFINRKENGELLTPNSIKYWTKAIKKELYMDFHFHALRKTHATIMANLNTPALELMQRLGHKKYETTMQYYINANELARAKLKQNLEALKI